MYLKRGYLAFYKYEFQSGEENTRWSTWQGETRGPELTFNSLLSARAYNCCLLHQQMHVSNFLGLAFDLSA